MKKVLAVIVSVFSLMCLLISCSNDSTLDEVFNATVTFDGNGATAGEMTVQTVGLGKEARLNANSFEKTDFDFVGWNTESDGSGKPYEDGQKIKVAGNITLYAQWEIVPIILDDNSVHWTDGNVYILNSDVTIDYDIIVSGSVTLILNDGCTLTASYGITVNVGNSLTINASGEGTGTLEVPEFFGGGAGIGGDNGCACGTITINGGTVNAISKSGGAGIGGGYNGAGGTITINGGTVNASGYGGAGIGGGEDGVGGTITINGGTVNASGTGGGAGIGGGYGGACGTITINDGTVNASGIEGGAGIGGGYDGAGGTITINDGTVNASGISGFAGIGRGLGGTDDGTLKLGSGVSLEVSSDGSDWSDYDGTTRQMYMRTK